MSPGAKWEKKEILALPTRFPAFIKLSQGSSSPSSALQGRKDKHTHTFRPFAALGYHGNPTGQAGQVFNPAMLSETGKSRVLRDLGPTPVLFPTTVPQA